MALDRQERGQGELSAIQEVQKELEIPVHALITMKDLMDYLEAKGEKEALANMQAYRENTVSKTKGIPLNRGMPFNIYLKLIIQTQ